MFSKLEQISISWLIGCPHTESMSLQHLLLSVCGLQCNTVFTKPCLLASLLASLPASRKTALSVWSPIALSLYPFESQRRAYSTFVRNFDFKTRREHKKNSYERRAYESVDVRSLFWVISHWSAESSTLGLKGL